MERLCDPFDLTGKITVVAEAIEGASLLLLDLMDDAR